MPIVKPVRDRRLLQIYTIIFIDVLVGSVVGPILPAFVKGLHWPQLWLAMGTGLFLGMQLFSAPLLGKLSDAYGRKPIFIVSAIGTFLADCFLLPIRVGYYFANRISDGTTNGMYATARSAITDISPKEQLFKNLGIEGAIVSLGFVIGPAAAGLLLTMLEVVEGNQAKVIALMGVTLSGINMVISFFLPETHSGSPGASDASVKAATLKRELIQTLNVFTLWKRLTEKDRKLSNDEPGDVELPRLKQLVLMQLAFTFTTGYYSYFVTFISFGELQMDAKAISYFFMFFGFLSIIISYVFYTYIADRIDQRRGIFWAALLGVPVILAYSLVGKSLLLMYIIVTLDCLTLSLVEGLIQGLMARRTTDDDRGEVFGISQALQGLANFATTLVFGALSLLDLRLPFVWFGACLATVAWLAWRRQPKPTTQPG